MKGRVFIIAGPSGVGKNFIINRVLEHFDYLTSIPTYTSRPPREEDKDSKLRICISDDEFCQMIESAELIDFKKIHGFYYGKRISDADKAFSANKGLVLDIDVQGLSDYKKIFKDRLVSIFVAYEDLKQLKNRILINRPDSTEQDIEIRYETAKKEMLQQNNYDYSVINFEGKPEIAVKKVIEIISNNIDK